MNTISPLAVRKAIWHYAGQPEPTEHDPGKIGVIVNLMERELRNVDGQSGILKIADMRHLILGWLFCDEKCSFEFGISINSLTPQQVYGLWRWLAPIRTEEHDGPNIQAGHVIWLPRIEFPTELRGVLARAMRDWQTTQALAVGDHPSVRFGDLLAAVNEGDNQGGCILKREQMPRFQQAEMDFHP